MLLIAVLVILLLATVSDYSISNDEQVQHRYGEFIVNYYASGFADRALFYFGNLYLYGGLFDVIAVLLGKILPIDIYLIRHVLCGLIGIAGIVATWATARMIAGPRAGALAAVALAICGPWYGAMFNHTKDIPFAVAMVGATYFLLRATRHLPRPRLSDLLLFGLLMGGALGQSALGLLLAVYALLAIVFCAPRPFSLDTAARFFGRSFMLFLPAFALGYLVMMAAWPWSAISLLNPLRAIFAFAHLEEPVKTLLGGKTYLMAQVPRTYVPIYLGIKLPLVTLLGAVIALFVVGLKRTSDARRDRLRVRETMIVAMTALLPIVIQAAGRGPAFSGLRDFVFVVPSLAALAGIGFDGALTWLRDRQQTLGRIALGGLAVWFAWTASVLVRLHPYEYLYFNELVGGLAGASQRYDTDYWVNVMHEAVAKLENVLDREGGAPGPYRVAVCGERTPFEHEAAVRRRLQWAGDDKPADFFIAPTHMRCDAAVDGKIIIRIERMNVLIGVVKDRRALTRTNAIHYR